MYGIGPVGCIAGPALFNPAAAQGVGTGVSRKPACQLCLHQLA